MPVGLPQLQNGKVSEDDVVLVISNFESDANEILHIVPRMREMRWQFGAVLPEEVKLNLSEPELEYFSKYKIHSQEDLEICVS